MIWLTWRQHRKQALYTLIALAAVAAVMLPTGLAMHHSFTDSGLAACLAGHGTAQTVSANVPDCGALSQQFQGRYHSMTFVALLFVTLPVFVGIFLGAPLIAREVEHGTHRLVWTQGVSRRQWALVKFGLVGAAALALAAVYALGMTWWFAPLVSGNGGGRLGPLVFDVQGVAPIGYTLFAVAAGVYAGTLFKRVLPAMGVTLAGYVVVRVLIETLARPRYMSPLTASVPITGSEQFNNASGAWIYSNGITNGAGKLIMPNTTIGCGARSGSASVGAVVSATDPCDGGLLSQGLGPGPFSNSMQYQPGDRFWAFQGIESGIFLAVAVLLLVLAVRRIRRIS